RDVVQRASTKITERVLQRQITTVTETAEEDEDHTFDNTAGKANIAGVYQWVNKVYKVEMFDIGPRTIFDVMVPEPAALLWDQISLPPGPNAPQAPPPFTLAPVDLSIEPNIPGKHYFGQYLALYGVTGVPDIPATRVTVSTTYSVDKDHD